MTAQIRKVLTKSELNPVPTFIQPMDVRNVDSLGKQNCLAIKLYAHGLL